jgi:alpha,alpha-trehalase
MALASEAITGHAVGLTAPQTAKEIVATHPVVETPLDLYGPLYRQVELMRLFPDSKTFADALPLQPPAQIMADYAEQRPETRDELDRFVRARFRLPIEAAVVKAQEIAPGERTPIDRHIAKLWPHLTRAATTATPGGSLLAVPEPFVVPGGRFRELYYWDSYFTMLGLKADGRNDLVDSMIDDFGSLIDRYGHIPNGTRTYYVSRSQPPLFYAMLALSTSTDPATKARRLGWLKAEHAFWMSGEDGLKPGEAIGHVVRLPDGGVLNRPFDARDTPRDESYLEDVEVAKQTRRVSAAVYRDLRAGAETGWDFSSRWLADGRRLSTIHTTDILPADLNSLLFGMEQAIAQACREAGDAACADAFAQKAEARATEMRRYLWDPAASVFGDYDWRAGRRTGQVTAAALYPLFTDLATPQEAELTARAADRQLLAPGGLRTTTVRTGLQWDAPNGWAPLQWIAVSGLRRYGETALADQIACRFLATVERTYHTTGRLLEKYDVEEALPGGGGEYPLQDGFGWTNGVVLALRGASCPNTSPATVSNLAVPPV